MQENRMRITENIGAIDVEHIEGGVQIEQQSIDGDNPGLIFIPNALIEQVIKAMRSNEAA
jgi:regulator of RNase E activity RraA